MLQYSQHKTCIKNHTHVKKVGYIHLRIYFWYYWWTLKNPKNHNFEKMKKNCWIYHHVTHVYKKPIIQGAVPEIRSQTNFLIIFCSLPPSPKNPENQNFEQMNKASGDVIILTCATKNTIKWYRLSYSYMECNRYFFVI